MKRALCTIALALAIPASAQAAPFSPSLNYGFEVASQHMPTPPLCTSLDLQIVPNGEAGIVGESSPTPTEPGPCYIYAVRRLASPREFGAGCLLMYNALATLNGTGQFFTAMPHQCSSRIIFLLNHPHYLDRF